MELVYIKIYRKTIVNQGFFKSKLDTGRDTHCIKTGVQLWQGHKDLNPGPTVLETAALPTELYPYIKTAAAAIDKWWALRDSNPGLSGYEPEALTN